MIDGVERAPELFAENLGSNSGSVGCQTLNFVKVIEPCISSKVGLSICPLNLTIAVKLKIDLVYLRVYKTVKCYKIGSQAHLEAHRKKHKN